MKKIFGITFGGLQQKIFTLCLILLLIVFGAYTIADSYHTQHLNNTIEKANSDLYDTISDISEQSMSNVVNNGLIRNTDKEALIIDDMFGEVSDAVLTLRTFARELFKHSDTYAPKKYSGPYENETCIIELYHEGDADPDSSENLELITHMCDMMTALFNNSRQVDSCFIGTADGMLLVAYDKNSSQVKGTDKSDFPVRERYWYKQAVEAGRVCFTNIETHAFTGKQGVVCAAPIYKNGDLVAVVGADLFLDSISETVEASAESGGILCIVNEEGKVIFSPMESGTFKVYGSDGAPDLRASENTELSDFINASLSGNTGIHSVTVDNIDYSMAGAPLDSVGWIVISAMPEALINAPTEELLEQYELIMDDARENTAKTLNDSFKTVGILSVAALLVAVLGSIVLAKKIVGPIRRMVIHMNELKGGDIQFCMEDCYRTGDEIEVLAEAFASLSEKTVTYFSEVTRVTAEKERMGAELDVATRIQASMLPSVFPPYPDRHDFDIYAVMKPAGEVGGDFYDFFLVDEDHLAIVMADVSGKGIPAALFMVKTKTLIKNRTQMGGTPAEIIRDVNEQLCESNEAEMFVTTWLAVINLKTGFGSSVNAGHLYPAHCHAGGDFELVKRKHSPAVGVFSEIKFTQNIFRLRPGDTLFVYTDGVTEASDENNNMFGSERLIGALNKNKDKSLNDLLNNLRSDVESFVGKSPQFDDITMLALRFYGGNGKMN